MRMRHRLKHLYHARTHRPHVAADLATQVEDNEDNPTRQRTSELLKQLRTPSTCFSFVIFCFEFVNFKCSREAMLQVHACYMVTSISVSFYSCLPPPHVTYRLRCHTLWYLPLHMLCAAPCATYHVLPTLPP